MRGSGSGGRATIGEATPIENKAAANAMANDAGRAIGKDIDAKMFRIKAAMQTPLSAQA